MQLVARQNIDRAKNWLSHEAFPLWLRLGTDQKSGAFIESITFEGKPTTVPLRVMVQARQIYSFTEARNLGIADRTQIENAIAGGVDFMISRYTMQSGAFMHSVDASGKPVNQDVDLYAQAFALFGLANAYGVLGKNEIRERAQRLLKYLNSERRVKAGGYSEIKNGETLFQANPHMHLFEAALEWMKVDGGMEWRDLAREVFDLCQNKFIDPKSGALCEHFDQNWKPLLENGKFIWEPGHHYEWAWLLTRFEDAAGISAGDTPTWLFKLSEQYGVDRKSHLALDEVWSDHQPKKRSSRFWPQTERIKAAVALGLRSSHELQPTYADGADQGMTGLFRYFDVPTRGLWQDTLSENGEFIPQPAKASSLYHIINAIAEYITKRPRVFDGSKSDGTF